VRIPSTKGAPVGAGGTPVVGYGPHGSHWAATLVGANGALGVASGASVVSTEISVPSADVAIIEGTVSRIGSEAVQGGGMT
jgi:hypothetical protein